MKRANRSLAQLPIILESPPSLSDIFCARRLSVGANIPVNLRPERRRKSIVPQIEDPPTESLDEFLNELYNTSFMNVSPTRIVPLPIEPPYQPPYQPAMQSTMHVTEQLPAQLPTQLPAQNPPVAQIRSFNLQPSRAPPRARKQAPKPMPLPPKIIPRARNRAATPQRQRQQNQSSVGRSSAVQKPEPAPSRRRSVYLDRRDSTINRHLRPRTSIGGGPPVVAPAEPQTVAEPCQTRRQSSYMRPTKASERRASVIAAEHAQRRLSTRRR